jgi:hypothetical protein
MSLRLFMDRFGQSTESWQRPYPKDLMAAYSMLVNYLSPSHTRQNNKNGNQPKNLGSLKKGKISTVCVSIGPHAFVQPRSSTLTGTSGTNVVPGSDGVSHDTITCFNRNANGHYASSCPSAVSLVQHLHPHPD